MVRWTSRLGAPCAIKAMAAKLARLIYRMLREGMKYVDQGAAFYEAHHRQFQIKQLKWKAASLGYQVTLFRPLRSLTCLLTQPKMSERRIPHHFPGQTISHYRIIELLGGGRDAGGLTKRKTSPWDAGQSALKFLPDEAGPRSPKPSNVFGAKLPCCPPALNHPQHLALCTKIADRVGDLVFFIAMEIRWKGRR